MRSNKQPLSFWVFIPPQEGTSLQDAKAQMHFGFWAQLYLLGSLSPLQFPSSELRPLSRLPPEEPAGAHLTW